MLPNEFLAYSQILMHLFSAGILLLSGIKLYSRKKGINGIVTGFLLIVSTAVACLFVFFIFAYWFHVNLMGRSL